MSAHPAPFSVGLDRLDEFDTIIDVRSPAEFAEDHIPGAINCPVLDDEERIRVGTLYKQVSPFEAKKVGAALVSRNIARHIETHFLSKPKGWKPTKTAGTAGANYTEADYKTQLKKVADTQAVIDSVVGYITSVNYKDFPDVVNMMDDAVDQLGKIKDAKAKADEAAGKKDWNNAALWTEQIWQYQVKAADLGLRAKTYLEQNGAKKVK